MAFTLLTDPDNDALLIQDADHVDNRLIVATLADAIRLRNRLNAFIDTLESDAITTIDPPPPPIDLLTASRSILLSTAAAQALAAEYGYDLKTDTLRTAINRGQINAMKRGGRWAVPRADFLNWLQHLLPMPPT